jgi:GT2 family glycosyltransferase
MTQVEKNLFDIFILGFNNFDNTTKLCLQAIESQVKENLIHISVLDNGSTDDSPQKQRAYCSDKEVFSIYSNTNLGFAGGMNLLAKNSNATWLVFLGSDTIPSSDFIRKLQDYLPKIPNNYGVLGPTTNQAGTCQKIFFEDLTPNNYLELHTNLCKGIPLIVMPASSNVSKK